jgi:hypothetical protein
MLSENIRHIIKQELVIDPIGYNYRYFINAYRQSLNVNYLHSLLFLLQEPINETVISKGTMNDFYTFLNILPQITPINNINIIWILLSRISYETIPSVVSSINNIEADKLLYFLNNYGGAALLYAFGNPHYTEDELMLFETVTRNVLLFLVNNKSDVQEYAIKKENTTIPRITLILSGIPDSPNSINIDDFVDIINAID